MFLFYLSWLYFHCCKYLGFVCFLGGALFSPQAYFTKGAGRTSSSLSSPLWFPRLWGTDGVEASRAPAVTGRPKATSSWHRWLWHGASTGACMWEISTTSAVSTHLAMSQVSWSWGEAYLFCFKLFILGMTREITGYVFPAFLYCTWALKLWTRTRMPQRGARGLQGGTVDWFSVAQIFPLAVEIRNLLPIHLHN